MLVGQVLTRDNIVEIIKFAHREKLFIFADEVSRLIIRKQQRNFLTYIRVYYQVYQDNVYADNREFYSFKKITREMGDPYDKLELASFMSCSKGADAFIDQDFVVNGSLEF